MNELNIRFWQQSVPCRGADGQQSEAISITVTAMPKTLA